MQINSIEDTLSTAAKELNKIRNSTLPFDETRRLADKIQKKMIFGTEMAGNTLSDLHMRTLNKISMVDETFKQYEIDKLSNFINTTTIFESHISSGAISKKQKNHLLSTYKGAIEKYKTTKYIPATITHGDAHFGNIFTTKDLVAGTIDSETLIWSAKNIDGKIAGISDPLNDVGRYLGSLSLIMERYQLNIYEQRAVLESFTMVYLARTKWYKDPDMYRDFNSSLDFYYLRFLSVILSNPDTSPEVQKSVINILLTRYPIN